MNSTTENTGAEQANNNDRAPMTPSGWMRAAAYRRHMFTCEYAASLGDTAREGISDEDYATTMATLELMARNLGWDDNQGQPEWGPRGPWGARGYGRRGGGCNRGHGHSGHHRGGRGAKAHNKASKTEAKATKRAAKAAAGTDA